MAWTTLFEGIITRDWQYTLPMDAQVIRIRNLSTSPTPFVSKGWIARSRENAGVKEIFYLRHFFSDKETLILDLSESPNWLYSSSVAVRRSRHYKINWTIAIDYLEGYDLNRQKRVFTVTQDQLENGLFVANHDLQEEFVSYDVWDSNKRHFEVADVTIADDSNLIFDFSPLEPLEGFYKVVIYK
ncbi:MAG: hypothetical protein KME13_13090 [Myxacorys californica WJT36-NPBG1]|jgi:hypothetical protein|nr:hypothetical protein [Myxacorys californica WJT36-NPBG1]